MPTIKPPTLKDIALRTGVSKQAVSAVLSGSRSGTRVSSATRDQILAAANEMQYRPNVIARSLRGQRTNTIGFYSGTGLVTARDPFFLEIVQGMRQGCSGAGKRFLLFGDYLGQPADAVYADLLDGQLDGLVVQIEPWDPLALRLADSPIPVVAIAECVPVLPSVVADDRGGSRQLAEHIARKGHRRVLYRKRHPDDRDSCLYRRYTAFCEAASESGITIIDGEGDYCPVSNQLRLSANEARWLAAPDGQRPTAAVCHDDQSAYCLLADCRRLGIRVPEDLAVAGFDGCPAIMDHSPRVTTVRAGWTNVVQTAISHVLALQEGREVPMETIIPAELIVGETA